MPHGADLLSCLERVRSAQNTEESTPCTLSTKIEPDSRGTSPAMTKKIAVDWRFPIPFYMICIISYSTGASMAAQTVSAIAAALDTFKDTAICGSEGSRMLVASVPVGPISDRYGRRWPVLIG